jgi:uncharacterized protein
MSEVEKNKHALITYVADKLGKGKLGKKALQKIMHLIQDLEKVPVGYSFPFYTYGPFSDDLSFDADIVKMFGGITMDYDSVNNAYSISSGENAKIIIKEGEAFLNQYKAGISNVLDRFGNKTAKELELLSTIVYLKREDSKISDASLVSKVRALKPKYSENEINAAFSGLKGYSYF